jgi:hypothetical protein
MRMREKRIPKKLLHTKMEEKQPKAKSSTKCMDQIRKDIEVRGKNWEEIEEWKK